MLSITLSDLPDDIIEEIFIYFIRDNKFRTAVNLAQTTKTLYNLYLNTCNNQCKNEYNNYKSYLHIKYHLMSSESKICIAAQFYNFEVVRFFHEDHEYDQKLNTFYSAAEGGHLDTIQWLCKNRKNDHCTSDVIDIAAKNGHLDIIEFLYEKWKEGFYDSEAPYTTNAMDYAASEGHLEIVKFLHDNSVGKRELLCTNLAMDWASENGHIEIVK